MNDPLRYLESLATFAYRGMWVMEPNGLAGQINPAAFYALSAILVLCFLSVFLSGLIAGNRVVIAAFGLGAGAFLFHTALTHAIPRYNQPITPLVIIAVLYACVALGRHLLRPRWSGLRPSSPSD